MYSLGPKDSNVTLVPYVTLIKPNTLSVKVVITIFWINTKRKTVMTLIRDWVTQYVMVIFLEF